MTYNPSSLVILGRYWVEQGGVNLGVVGDTAHADKGVSYHLGKSQLLSTAYSIRTARDKAGLSEAASAIDLGKLEGSLKGLQAFSRWLTEEARKQGSGEGDIREVIYSPDGTAVRRWDNVSQQLYVGGTDTGHGDNSHRWHTHISFYRDSEERDKVALFRPYFEVEEESMTIVHPTAVGPTRRAHGTNVPIYLPDGTTKTVPAFDGLVDAEEYTISQSDNKAPKGSGWVRLASSGLAGWYAPAASLVIAPAAPADCTEALEKQKAAVLAALG